MEVVVFAKDWPGAEVHFNAAKLNRAEEKGKLMWNAFPFSWKWNETLAMDCGLRIVDWTGAIWFISFMGKHKQFARKSNKVCTWFGPFVKVNAEQWQNKIEPLGGNSYNWGQDTCLEPGKAETITSSGGGRRMRMSAISFQIVFNQMRLASVICMQTSWRRCRARRRPRRWRIDWFVIDRLWLESVCKCRGKTLMQVQNKEPCLKSQCVGILAKLVSTLIRSSHTIPPHGIHFKNYTYLSYILKTTRALVHRMKIKLKLPAHFTLLLCGQAFQADIFCETIKNLDKDIVAR